MSLRVKIDDADSLEELTQALGQLSFGVPYWPVNKDNLLRTLESALILHNGAEPEDLRMWPMFLNSANAYDGSVANQVLSVYGPTAPSFMNTGSKAVGITAPVGKDSAEEDLPLDHLYVSLKNLAPAITDWKKMEKEHVIYQDPNERARTNRNIAFTGEAKKAIWTGITKIGAAVISKTNKGKKRVADVEGDAPNAKKAKPAEKAKVFKF
jgi:hypothetical protein